jgi:hypothetical protein
MIGHNAASAVDAEQSPELGQSFIFSRYARFLRDGAIKSAAF